MLQVFQEMFQVKRDLDPLWLSSVPYISLLLFSLIENVSCAQTMVYKSYANYIM